MGANRGEEAVRLQLDPLLARPVEEVLGKVARAVAALVDEPNRTRDEVGAFLVGPGGQESLEDVSELGPAEAIVGDGENGGAFLRREVAARVA